MFNPSVLSFPLPMLIF